MSAHPKNYVHAFSQMAAPTPRLGTPMSLKRSGPKQLYIYTFTMVRLSRLCALHHGGLGDEHLCHRVFPVVFLRGEFADAINSAVNVNVALSRLRLFVAWCCAARWARDVGAKLIVLLGP